MMFNNDCNQYIIHNLHFPRSLTCTYRLYNYTGYTEVMKDNKKHYAIDINSDLVIEERKKVKKKLDLY